MSSDWKGRVRRAAAAAASQNGAEPDDAGDIFVTQRGNAMEPVRFAWENWIELGVWDVLLGAGGIGKGLVMARLIAEWTRGNLPGEFKDQPINFLVVAHEDRQHNTWDPRILAAGGDLERVEYMTYAEGTPREKRIPRDFNRHCARLEQDQAHRHPRPRGVRPHGRRRGGHAGNGVSASTPVRGTIAEPFKVEIDSLLELKTNGPIDVADQTITIQPGGHTGSHRHPGPALVVIKSGSSRSTTETIRTVRRGCSTRERRSSTAAAATSTSAEARARRPSNYR